MSILHTRKKCEEAVSHPGKFEGQNPWVPYFWELACRGEANAYVGNATGFIINEDDVQVFPELQVEAKVWFVTDENGCMFELTDDLLEA